MGPKSHVGGRAVEPDLNRLVRADGTVQIEPKAMDVLAFPASHPGEVRPNDSIVKEVWPDTFVRDDVPAHGISEPRKVFGDDARADPPIFAGRQRHRLGNPTISSVLPRWIFASGQDMRTCPTFPGLGSIL